MYDQTCMHTLSVEENEKFNQIQEQRKFQKMHLCAVTVNLYGPKPFQPKGGNKTPIIIKMWFILEFKITN